MRELIDESDFTEIVILKEIPYFAGKFNQWNFHAGYPNQQLKEKPKGVKHFLLVAEKPKGVQEVLLERVLWDHYNNIRTKITRAERLIRDADRSKSKDLLNANQSLSTKDKTSYCCVTKRLSKQSKTLRTGNSTFKMVIKVPS
ncbi:hypothetical protein CROQUDRAFT_97250 [Cronartium quercuum f. sp. fusiforme G11]|uniref:Uncharacterized protein n=1 Tax=Cronartium quercuum f. sp. fusiforme G11 TaxID=708437 RepID=A0A9P6T8K2_9BASI|nr:hypothetical protein CROQUDRAFT_97250 [Cronartium quercuum f. sp. fusiforme G11]